MSLENIENLIASIIKSGDKDTISDCISLLEEIRDYKKPVKSSHHSSKPSERTSQKFSEKSQKKPSSPLQEELGTAASLLDYDWKEGQLTERQQYHQPLYTPGMSRQPQYSPPGPSQDYQRGFGSLNGAPQQPDYGNPATNLPQDDLVFSKNPNPVLDDMTSFASNLL
jgi:hypothetical protein